MDQIVWFNVWSDLFIWFRSVNGKGIWFWASPAVLFLLLSPDPITQMLCSNPTLNNIRNWCRVVSDAYVGIIQGLSEFFILIVLYLTNIFLITMMNGAQLSGILGEVTGGKGHALVPWDDQWLELSIYYHKHNSHFRMPPFLSSYHKHLTHSSESTTYSIPPCNNGKKKKKRK